MFGFDHSVNLSLRVKNEVKDAAFHCMQWTCSDKAVCFPAPSGSPRAFSPRDDKVCWIVNTRGGDFRSASLYSSPPPAHPTTGFCEAKSFVDDAGPRRVSKLSLVKNPFHSNQRGSQHGSQGCCCGCWGSCCCAQLNAGSSRRCSRNHPV